MQTTVNLQEPFTYSIIPLMVVFGLLVAVGVYLIYLIETKEKQKEDVKEISEKNIKNVPVIKGKYMNQLDSIEYKYISKMIEVRDAYQLISEAMRMFVFEITDITTQNYCLTEIEKLNIPKLYELIKEYYEPEFASKSKGDFSESINKARRVIKEWN